VTNLLVGIRYMLLLLPAIASMLLESYASYGRYTLYILLLLWLSELRRIVLPTRFHAILIVLEIGFGAWLSLTFQGVLFIVFYSTMISYLLVSSDRVRYLFLFLQLVLLHLSLSGRAPFIYVTADLLFITFALLLLHIRVTSKSMVEVEQLYDVLRRKHYELDAAKERLIDYARQVEDIAQVEERNRISRDIHDDLGHKLIRLKMMMEASIRILPHQQNKGMEMIHAVRDQLTESMEVLRATVRKLKPDEDTIQHYTLDKLIEDWAKDQGIHVHYESSGMPYPLYPSLEFILYRNAQEAITNAICHGAATEVQITLHFETKRIILYVSNNGSALSAATAKGLGISGMEERTKLVGGQLLITYEAPFTVTTILPTMYRNNYNAEKGVL
jgi:two-component system NarL family sensor kinase